MNATSEQDKIIHIQAKIISTLLAAPFYKLGVYINTEFDKLFLLDEDEKEGLDLAWAMLTDDHIVYSDFHEIGLQSDSLVFASRFVETVNARQGIF
jgi:hypothetical protein